MRETPGLAAEHVAIYEQARKFGETHAAIAARENAEASRELVAKLGATGLLRHGVGKISLRAASVVRETLAWHHGLIDLAFAMQGLGSYALALVGEGTTALEEIASGKAVAAFA